MLMPKTYIRSQFSPDLVSVKFSFIFTHGKDLKTRLILEKYGNYRALTPLCARDLIINLTVSIGSISMAVNAKRKGLQSTLCYKKNISQNKHPNYKSGHGNIVTCHENPFGA